MRRPNWVSPYEFAQLISEYKGTLAADGNSARVSCPTWVSDYEFANLVREYNA